MSGRTTVSALIEGQDAAPGVRPYTEGFPTPLPYGEVTDQREVLPVSKPSPKRNPTPVCR